MNHYLLQVITYEEVASWVSFINRNSLETHLPYNIPDELIIDFSNTHDIKPYHIVSLACLIEEYHIAGVQIRFPETENSSIDFLHQLKFFQYWSSGFNRREYHISEDRTSLCLWQIDKEMFNSYVSHAQAYFQKQFFRGWDLLPLSRSLVELFFNVIDHAQSKVSGYVFTKYFKSKKHIIISLCDFGLGIPETVNAYLLKTEDRMLTDLDALDKAFEQGFTVKSKINNGGLGLDIILTLTKTLKSTLLIVSNRAHYTHYPDGTIVRKEIPVAFKGTLVVLTLNTQNLIRLNDEEQNIFH